MQPAKVSEQPSTPTNPLKAKPQGDADNTSKPIASDNIGYSYCANKIGIV